MMKVKTNYLLKKGEDGFFVEEQPKFILPKKIYGDVDSVVDRVLETFKSRSNNLGVLFSGIKGNSKTTTGKMICVKSGLPVLLISEPFTGADFKAYLSSIKDQAIVFIDEFEKVYNTEELQQEFLSILDGVFQGKKLFMFTSNNAKINEFLRNRPSRIFYHFKHDNLDESTVNDIIEQELQDKSYEADLRAILMILGTISVDVLLNYIDEINRFKRSPKELIKGLNVEVEQTHFSVVLIVNGERHMTKCDFNPLLQKDFFFDYKKEKGGYGYFYGSFTDYSMYTRGNSFVFENLENKMIFTPFKPFKFEL